MIEIGEHAIIWKDFIWELHPKHEVSISYGSKV